MSTADEHDHSVMALLHGDAPVPPEEIERICGDLVGPAQPLVELISQAVATGDLPSLRLLHEGNTPLHGLLDELLDTDYPAVNMNAGGQESVDMNDSEGSLAVPESAAVRAVRSLAGLARGLLDPDRGGDLLRAGLTWCAAANASPTSLEWSAPSDALAGGDPRLSRQLAELGAVVVDHPHLASAAPAVAVTLLCLARPAAVKGPSTGLTVLFTTGGHGLRARLTATLIPTWPAGLVPDPRRMSLFTADQTFRSALTRAWTQAGRTLPGAVLWSIENPDGPVGHIVGESLGAAFAVVLEELRRRHRPFYRSPALFRLVGTNAVVGRIDDRGNLQQVGGYEQKLRAAGKNARVIVPTPDEQKAHEAGADVVIVPAPHWRAAAKLARRPDAGPIARWLVVPLAVLLIVTGIAVADRQRTADERRREVLSRQASQRSEELREADPVLSGLLSALAWHYARTPEARYGLLATTATTVEAVLEQHRGFVLNVAYSADGSTLATVSGGGTIRLWDTTRGHRLIRPPVTGHRATTFGLALSPRDDVLATTDDHGFIRLWNVPDGRAIGHPLRHGTEPVRLVAFGRNGSVLVTVSWDGTVQSWDVATRRAIGRPVRQPADSTAKALSPDGTLLAITRSDKGPVRLWDIGTRRNAGAPLGGAAGSDAGQVWFSRDRRRLAVTSGDRVRLWDLVTRRPIGEPLRVPAAVSAVAFGPDGRTLAMGYTDRSIQLWDIARGQPIGNPLRGHTGIVGELVFDPRGRILASAANDGTTRLWNLGLLSSAGDPVLRHAGPVSDLTYRQDGGLIASSSRNGTTRLWDPATRRPRGGPIRGHTGQVNTVALSGDGKVLATGGEDGNVRFWDQVTRRPAGLPAKAHEGAVLSVTFSPDGRLLASTGDDGVTRLWHVATRTAAGPPLRGYEGGLYEEEDPYEYVHTAAFSPDGRILATGSADTTARLWDVATGRAIGRPLDVGVAVWDLTFSPDGRTLATADDAGLIRLWDVATGRRIGDPMSVQGEVAGGVEFSPDGRTLAVGVADGTARLWDVATRRPLGDPLGDHGTGYTYVAFSADGGTLATGGADGAVRLWNVALPADPSAAVCAIAERSLTEEEWRRYLPGEPFTKFCGNHRE